MSSHSKETMQIDIFVYLNSKTMEIGDEVTVIFEENELGYVNDCFPHLLKTGKIISRKIDFFHVAFGSQIETFSKDKLIRT